MTRQLTAAEEHALNLIYGMSVEPKQVFEWTRHGRLIGGVLHEYDYTKSNAFKALVELRQAGAGGGPVSSGGSNPPAPAPTPSPLAQKIQNVIYCAQSPLEALGCTKPGFKPALTADPGYASFNTPSVVAQLKAHFGTCGAWFVQTQVSVDHARAFVAELGLDFLIFQGETSEEYRTAVNLGARLMIGNANSWSESQRSDATNRVNAGVLAFCQETYTNLGQPWPENASAGGVPAASFCIGVYDGTNEVPGRGWDPSVADYKAHTSPAAWAGISIYHAAGVRDWWSL